MDWSLIAREISAATGEPFTLDERLPVGGGCISDAWRITGSDGRRFFVKTNGSSRLEMFTAEADGLRAIIATATVRAPVPICSGSSGESAYLVLEYLPLGGGPAFSRLGEELAEMHRHTREEYGWWRDNTIGSTPQIHTPAADWVTFWRDQRLGYQLGLARRNGHAGKLLENGERLLESLPFLFSSYTPAPSLLHGDLWSGNQAVLSSGEPVIFDPAVYYGDREADIAMTELFGGFPGEFYAAYNGTWPLDEGYGVRRDLYNLYHILNHLNLFGGGYLRQARQMMERLLSELN